MQVSINIVSKNRKNELERTLHILCELVNFDNHEILVFLDGSIDESKALKNVFKDVKWFESIKSLGASASRHELYSKAKGNYLIGLDDDAHPLTKDFIQQVTQIFEVNKNVGIIAFQEIKGVFNSDREAMDISTLDCDEFYTNDFIGCGFAIRKEVYDITKGFPKWIDIYGEESCLSLEVLNKGFDIFYSNKIKVNHRVNLKNRKIHMQNYFRFEKQLKNTTYYYLVYYPNPIKKIIKLFWHNFKKYALMDIHYFRLFFKTILIVIFNFSRILKYRKPVDKSILKKMKEFKHIKY